MEKPFAAPSRLRPGRSLSRRGCGINQLTFQCCLLSICVLAHAFRHGKDFRIRRAAVSRFRRIPLVARTGRGMLNGGRGAVWAQTRHADSQASLAFVLNASREKENLTAIARPVAERICVVAGTIFEERTT